MTVKENLIAAKALIDTPENWNTSGSFGSNGCYCAVGAIELCEGHPEDFSSYPDEWVALWNALPAEHKSTGEPRPVDIFSFNDLAATHADIMALFDRAIEACDD